MYVNSFLWKGRWLLCLIRWSLLTTGLSIWLVLSSCEILIPLPIKEMCALGVFSCFDFYPALIPRPRQFWNVSFAVSQVNHWHLHKILWLFSQEEHEQQVVFPPNCFFFFPDKCPFDSALVLSLLAPPRFLALVPPTLALKIHSPLELWEIEVKPGSHCTSTMC